MRRVIVALLFSCALAAVVACTSRVAPPAKNLGSKVYFVPIGDFPTDQIMRLARYYQREFGLEIPVLKSVAIPANAMDSNRGHLVAEKLAEDLRNEFPQLAGDPQAILIGFTTDDVYIAAKQWKFAFGWRDDARTAVVSTARMDLHYFGQPFWGSSPEVRLRKMVTKDIGILYYGLPQSNDPKSVLYNNIMGIQELDAVGEDF